MTPTGEAVRITSDALARLGSKLHHRDQTIVDEFSDAVDVTLVGSEAGESARGKPAIAEFFRAAFGWPVRICWEWSGIDVCRQADILWFFAEGAAVITADTGENRKPYRLSGILALEDGVWRWRMFHGSEPVTGSG